MDEIDNEISDILNSGLVSSGPDSSQHWRRQDHVRAASRTLTEESEKLAQLAMF